MLDMPTIQSIRSRRAKGETLSQIAEHEGVSIPTVRKYLSMTDFSPSLPIANKHPSILDPYKDIIEGYLDQDEKAGTSSAIPQSASMNACSKSTALQSGTQPFSSM